LICGVESKFESRIMDYGASFLVSPCRDLMKIFRTRNFDKVFLVDDEALCIVGMGYINFGTSTSII